MTRARKTWPRCSANSPHAGLVNIVGGCCGTTPDAYPRHCARPSPARRRARFPSVPRYLRLSGLEPFTLTPEIPFVNVGERTNVTGSAKFRKLVTDGDYAAALDVARDQVANGAQIIDVNMDEGLLDSEKAMADVPQSHRLRARYRPRADHGRFLEIHGDRGRAEMRAGQAGRQLDLDEGGRGGFLEHAQASCAAMARPSSSWPSTSRARPTPSSARSTICTRAYDILIEQVGFPPEDIIFDPEHLRGRDRHRGARQLRRRLHRGDARIRQNLPHAHISGGVSNLSFSFRGNEPVREAMHSVFLYHAIKAGMDMGIVNAGQLAVYDDLDPELREACEDVVLNRRAGRHRAAARAGRALQRPAARSRRKPISPGARCRSRSGWRMRSSTASPISSTDDAEEARLQPSGRST